jgi:LacI family transcriptional regulator
MPVRLKDLAQDLNLSVVTISKVLRNRTDISPETRKRVLKRMKELNYHPNLAARSLITGRTWTVGLVVPDLLHPFFAQIAKEISAAMRPKGYSLFISSSEEDPELEEQEVRQLLARRVDVLVIASAQTSVESFRGIEEFKIPYVLIDRKVEGLEANFVGVDDRAVGELATRHLIEQGCRRIAHIRGPEVSTALDRLQGYRQALFAHRMAPLPGHIVTTGLPGAARGNTAGYEAATDLLALPDRPDGIFCFNDPVAIGAMRAIRDAGLRIPGDVAVVGCGNLDNSDFLRIPLTSIDQRNETIGKQTAALALKLAQSKVKIRPKSQLMPIELIVRESSRRIPDPVA